ncbi:hypothetical protein JZ751_017021 [Albula glossodonta]|uniref:E3 ubiquitin-protein ligase n=1 Tax=Albula glossodonta TaxID=121402 RepID=A0A8T2MI13_9TELE|nr:hypothetical protein JZ751_017021 [Albula glossodonta]
MAKISGAGRGVGSYSCFTQTRGSSGGKATAAEGETCPLCRGCFQKKQRLKCTHAFCAECVRRSVESLGKPFVGIRALGYLPNTPEGKEVLRLLKRAFDQRLIFTVEATSEGADRVVYNDIPHSENLAETSTSGFLEKVRAALRAKGIE